ncbi:MAG TPA: hypothetical protein PKY88_09930 [Anaerohalosphaeraceae bacterium]|nr:hypothetical protein [Anaerohalosphaeraceae bacterium]
MKAILLLCAAGMLFLAAGCQCGCAVQQRQMPIAQTQADAPVQTQLTVEVQGAYGRSF